MKHSFSIDPMPFLRGTAVKRGAIFGSILVAALLAFEVFNFSTTAFALTDVLGNLKSGGLQWSIILAFAFCGIDFAGIARLFTPQQGRDESNEVWYLFGAWMLAASFNAILTWWGVSVAIVNHTSEGSILVGQTMLLKVVPIFVAVMVWMIRVLIIGTFSLSGENLFSLADDRAVSYQTMRMDRQPAGSASRVQPQASYPRPAPKPTAPRPVSRPEPTYHPLGMGARSYEDNPSLRK